MKACVLFGKQDLRIVDYEEKMAMGPHDVRIQVKTVGVCGSDVHYFREGRIGAFVVKEPMVLGHEASGVIVETGAAVTHLDVGDVVCMEPGIPEPGSEMTLRGTYNLDPAIRFWATPPVDGCLRESVVHPASLTFRLPEGMSLAEGAMVEPLSVGIQAATKAVIRPGDVALVFGAGAIGICTALAALAGGCSRVLVADVRKEKLQVLESYEGLVPVHLSGDALGETLERETAGKGVEIVFEASGNPAAIAQVFVPLRPAGRVVLIGMPSERVPVDVVAAQCKEAQIVTVFRYANIYPKTVNLIGSGRIDVNPLLSRRFGFDESIDAFRFAAEGHDEVVKVLIEMNGEMERGGRRDR